MSERSSGEALNLRQSLPRLSAAISSPDAFISLLRAHFSEALKEMGGSEHDLTLEAAFGPDLGFDSIMMLELLDVLSELVGPKAHISVANLGPEATARCAYLECLEALQRPIANAAGE